MLSALLFFSFSAFANQGNHYTYQTQVVASASDCAAEAAQWGQRFSQATGINVKTSACRSEQTLVAEDKTYKVYNLGLTYAGPNPRYPYAVMLGKKDALDPVRFDKVPLYPTMESCLADISHQTRLYEEQTGLKTVTTTCVADAPVVTVTQYFLKIEGFEKNGKYSNSRPQKYLYTFAPLAFEDLADTRQAEFGQFLASFDATIVKQSPGLFVYYRAGGPLPLNAEIKAYYRNQNECESQIEHVYTLYTNAGSQKIISWCREGRLQVLYDGSFYLSQIPGVNNTEYATLDQCLADQEFVLADSRNSHAVGALCAPNMYNSAVYSMILYRKGW